MNRRQVLSTLAAGLGGTWSASATLAQPASAPAPARTGRVVKLIVPFPPGGNADAIARVFADAMMRKTGHTVIVDNRPGASGTIGAEAALRAEPDGSTLYVTVTSQLTNVALGVKPSYDGPRDFTAITGLCVTPLIVAATAALPVKNMRDFAAVAKTRPMAFGSYGAGTSTHILQEVFARQIGVDMVHVPYKGEAPMLTDLVANQIQMGMVPPSVAREMRKVGKLVPLATVGQNRSEFVPEVPTFAELGYRNLDWIYGVGIYVSSRTPQAIRQQLEQISQDIIRDPQVQAKYRSQSNQPWGASAEELQKRLVIDSVQWDKLVATYGKAS